MPKSVVPDDLIETRKKLSNLYDENKHLLSARELELLDMYYGLNPNSEFFTLDEIAKHIGKSRETVRQGIKRAVEKLMNN